MDWIIHLDTDELIHPAGAREYSMRQLLAEVPGNVDMVIFPNYVSGLVSFLYLLCMEYYGSMVSIQLLNQSYFILSLCSVFPFYPITYKYIIFVSGSEMIITCFFFRSNISGEQR